KFTEVGYVGRDVESIVRYLMELSVKLFRDEEAVKEHPKAVEAAEEALLDLLLPPRATTYSYRPPHQHAPAHSHSVSLPAGVNAEDNRSRTREKLRKLLREGNLDDREVEVEIQEDSSPFLQIFGGQGVEEMGL